MKTSTDGSASVERLNKTLRLYRALTLFFAVATAGFSLSYLLEYVQRESPFRPKMIVQEDAPHSGFVKKIIEPLRYSGLPDLVRPEVSLRIDFQNKTWTLKNIHRFDAGGHLLLNDGRYGICGDLSAYVYQKIEPVFGERYKIEFLDVFESTFFRPGAGSHIILRIADLEGGMQGNQYKKIYVLDPSLRRYGDPSLFPDYLPKERYDRLPFLAEKNPDDTFEVGEGPPILINRNAFVMLSVTDREGQFDPDNYRIALSLRKKYQYRSDPIFIMEKREGRVFTREVKDAYEGFIKKRDYERLKERIGVLFLNISAH